MPLDYPSWNRSIAGRCIDKPVFIHGVPGTTESFVCWSAGGGERTTAAPASNPALVNEEGRLDYICYEVGCVELAVRIPSIHLVCRFAR